jgi:hypothetical protein
MWNKRCNIPQSWRLTHLRQPGFPVSRSSFHSRPAFTLGKCLTPQKHPRSLYTLICMQHSSLARSKGDPLSCILCNVSSSVSFPTEGYKPRGSMLPSAPGSYLFFLLCKACPPCRSRPFDVPPSYLDGFTARTNYVVCDGRWSVPGEGTIFRVWDRG